MACLDDVYQALLDIGARLNLTAGCGCGSGGGPASSPAARTDDFGDITEETGTPPDGYESWSQYQILKCDIATWIVSSLLKDVQWMQTQQIAALTLGALAAGFGALLSGGTLLAILGVLLAILAYEIGSLQEAEDAIQDSFDDLVCALVNGETASGSISNFSDAIDTALAAQTSDPVALSLLATLLNYWADTTAVNLMYAPLEEALAVQIPAEGDCADCGLDCDTDYVSVGEYLGGNLYSSEFLTDTWYITIWFNSTGAAGDCSLFCGPEVDISLLGLSGYTAKSSTVDSFRIWGDSDCPFNSNNAGVYSSDTQPDTSPRCGRVISIFSTTEFTANIQKGDVC